MSGCGRGAVPPRVPTNQLSALQVAGLTCRWYPADYQAGETISPARPTKSSLHLQPPTFFLLHIPHSCYTPASVEFSLRETTGFLFFFFLAMAPSFEEPTQQVDLDAPLKVAPKLVAPEPGMRPSTPFPFLFPKLSQNFLTTCFLL